MSQTRALYLVPKTLDAQTRLLGLPLDECIPSLSLAVFFFALDKVMLSISLPVLAVILIKMAKQGQGSSWLLNLCHWYLPSVVMQCVLTKTPPSRAREYIA